MKKTGYFVVSILMTVICGCHSGVEGDGKVAEGVELRGDTVRVAKGSVVAGRLETEVVRLEECSLDITTTGEVTAIPTQYAEVSSPMAGRVVKSFVHLGQTVGVGSALYEVSSSDYSEVVKNYMQSKSELEQAKRKLARVKDLRDNNVASAKELEEAQMEYDIAQEEFNHAAAVGREYHLDLGKAVVGQPLVVRSPVRGKVLKCDIVTGEYLKEDEESKVIVADLDKVWVKVNISEKQAPMVENIERVEVRLVAMQDSVVEGKITYVGGMLDPETRTLQTVVECRNEGHKMLPNMYATVTLKAKSQKSIVLRKEAVLQDTKGRYVLTKEGEGVYVKRYVEVESLGEKQVVVNSGLEEGEEVVAKGAFYLVRG